MSLAYAQTEINLDKYVCKAAYALLPEFFIDFMLIMCKNISQSFRRRPTATKHFHFSVYGLRLSIKNGNGEQQKKKKNALIFKDT